MDRTSKFDHPVAVSIFGLGYVGAVMAACLAHQGHDVIGVDLNSLKVESFNDGRSPIAEPQMEELVSAGHAAGRLHATLDPFEAVLNTRVSFICVGTPSLRNGSLDLRNVERACEQVGEALRSKADFHTVAVRSTLLPGSIESVVIPALEKGSGKRVGYDFSVCCNPEFIREGSAVSDFLHPAFTLLGTNDRDQLAPLRAIYKGLPAPIRETSLRTAEMVKYACNAWHAVKIDFANELGTLCQHLDVKAEEVMEIFCSDTRLNLSSAYLKPGFAFGGSCLPKDVKALTHRGRQLDLQLPLLDSIIPSNQAHLQRAVEMILATGKRQVGLLGLSFKSGTDDLRESPMLQMVKQLLGEGCDVRIYDRNVSWSCIHGANREFAQAQIPHVASLLHPRIEDVISQSEVIVIGNADEEYRNIGNRLNGQIVLDLVRLDSLPQAAHTLC